MRPIDADMCIAKIKELPVTYDAETVQRCIEILSNAPNIDAVPVKHGECEYIVSKGKNGYSQEYRCSVCGDSFYWTHDKMFPNKFNYCRNCGRKIVKFIDESKG